jgi:polysaccharide export outer membrane protein
MKGNVILITLLLGLTVIGGRAQNNPADPGGNVNDTVVPPPTEPKLSVKMSTVSVVGPNYVIDLGDMLHISVWKDPDFTSTLPVREDGMISVPLLNDVLAAGLTPMQLSALLTQKLKTYLEDPHVTVIVTQTSPHRIYVVGEVSHTGPISLLPNMTVLQALATAGFSPFANTKKIYVLRTENGQHQKIPFHYKQVIKGDAASQDVKLKPGDTIVVP